MTEDAVIVCGSVDDLHLIPGSTQDVCSRCGTDVVVSPSGREVIAREDAQVLCVACGTKLMEIDDDIEIVPLTPGQREEIAAAIAAGIIGDVDFGNPL